MKNCVRFLIFIISLSVTELSAVADEVLPDSVRSEQDTTVSVLPEFNGLGI